MPERISTPSKQRIEGIFTPNVVPLLPDGSINEAELRRYVDWLIDRGVHGLYPNGSTGEFTRFTPEERQRIVQDRLRAGRPAACPCWPGRPRRTSARRCRLRDVRRLRRPGGGHRLAVLLPALSRVGLRLFPRDRPAQRRST